MGSHRGGNPRSRCTPTVVGGRLLSGGGWRAPALVFRPPAFRVRFLVLRLRALVRFRLLVLLRAFGPLDPLRVSLFNTWWLQTITTSHKRCQPWLSFANIHHRLGLASLGLSPSVLVITGQKPGASKPLFRHVGKHNPARGNHNPARGSRIHPTGKQNELRKLQQIRIAP